MYVRTVKVRSSSGNVNEYVRVVEAFAEDGKVKQRVVADLGRRTSLSKCSRNSGGFSRTTHWGRRLGRASGRRGRTWGPILVIRALFDQLGFWEILGQHLGAPRTCLRRPSLRPHRQSFDRPRQRARSSPAGSEADFVCDRQGRRFVPQWFRRGRVRVHHRQLDAWYRTLDQLHAAKDKIELALYHRLRDLFSLKPDLVFYDIHQHLLQRARVRKTSPSTAIAATVSLRTSR